MGDSKRQRKVDLRQKCRQEESLPRDHSEGALRQEWNDTLRTGLMKIRGGRRIIRRWNRIVDVVKGNAGSIIRDESTNSTTGAITIMISRSTKEVGQELASQGILLGLDSLGTGGKPTGCIATEETRLRAVLQLGNHMIEGEGVMKARRQVKLTNGTAGRTTKEITRRLGDAGGGTMETSKLKETGDQVIGVETGGETRANSRLEEHILLEPEAKSATEGGIQVANELLIEVAITEVIAIE